jgi:hypothetical protein
MPSLGTPAVTARGVTVVSTLYTHVFSPSPISGRDAAHFVGPCCFSLRPAACVGQRSPAWECHRERDTQRQAARLSGDVLCCHPLQQRWLETY